MLTIFLYVAMIQNGFVKKWKSNKEHNTIAFIREAGRAESDFFFQWLKREEMEEMFSHVNNSYKSDEIRGMQYFYGKWNMERIMDQFLAGAEITLFIRPIVTTGSVKHVRFQGHRPKMFLKRHLDLTLSELQVGWLERFVVTGESETQTDLTPFIHDWRNTILMEWENIKVILGLLLAFHVWIFAVFYIAFYFFQ